MQSSPTHKPACSARRNTSDRWTTYIMRGNDCWNENWNNTDYMNVKSRVCMVFCQERKFV